MSEPPLPIIPTGQTRDFDLNLPDLPAPDGPGSEIGAGACDPVLVSLVDAYSASPTEANRDALTSYIESVTGQPIAQVLSPEWGQVEADCTPRTKTVTISGCEVFFTIDSNLVPGSTCSDLPTYQMTLTQHDFNLGSNSTGTTVVATSGAFQGFEQPAEFQVHLEDPALAWLPSTSSGVTTGYIVQRSSQLGFVGPAVESPLGSGNYYIPVIKIKGSLTAKVEHYRERGTTETTYRHSYSMRRPALAFRLNRRNPSGSSFPSVSDPIRTGTLGSGNTVLDSDYPISTINRNLGMSIDGLSTKNEFTLNAVSAPRNPYTVSGATTGTGDDVAKESEAWSSFTSAVSDYNSARTIHDPALTINASTREATVSFNTDDNAIYYRTWGCQTTAGPDHVYDLKYDMLTLDWGGYYNHRSSSGTPIVQVPPVKDPSIIENPMVYPLRRYIQSTDDDAGIAHTDYQRVVGDGTDHCVPFIDAAVVTDEGETPPGDGTPPPTTTNPPIVPVGGGCRSSLFGPSSCNWTVPRTPDVPMPNDNFPDVPTVKTNMPDLPDLPCIVPDFGNMDPCGHSLRPHGGRRTPAGRGGGAGPGTLGPLPGGRDMSGHRGGGAYAAIKTRGQTYAPVRTYTFLETTCPGQATPGIGCMAVIVQLLMDAGIDPVDIIFQVGPEWDKPFPVDRCFERGSRFWDAAMWTAQYLMLWIIDEGPPTNDVYIGPPWHRPLQTVWSFDEHYDLFGASRGFSSEEAYGWVEVFGPNVTSPVIVRIEDPFSTVDSPTFRVEVGANFTQSDAEGMGAYKASFLRRETVSVQAIVPYSSDYFLRDLMALEAPDRGFQESYVIVGKESDVSAGGRFHILTGMLPATLAEIDAFPEVADEYNAIEGGFA